MKALTTRQRDLLQSLMATSEPVGVAHLAATMNLTPRQVNYSLNGLRDWLTTRHVDLASTPGVGLKLQCSSEQHRLLVKELAESDDYLLVLSVEQRRADQFAPEVDFFSVGTIDLTQYTLAMDRQHPELTALSDGLHPAVLRLIAHTAIAAKAHDKWVSVCGELASDPLAATNLIGLGVTELSVSPPAVPNIKAQIRKTSLSAAKTLAESALNCGTAKEVRALGK